METEALKGSMQIQADLVKTLLGGQLQEQNLALDIAKVNIQMQLEAQQMAQAQTAIAQMTGVGGNLNAYV